MKLSSLMVHPLIEGLWVINSYRKDWMSNYVYIYIYINRVVLSNPLIYVSDSELTRMKEIVPYLEYVFIEDLIGKRHKVDNNLSLL